MSIYDSQGNKIPSGEDYTLGVDEVSGLLFLYEDGKKKGEGIDIGNTGVDVSDIAEFFQNDVTAAINYASSLTDSCIQFVAVTDQHYDKNNRLSAAILEALNRTGFFAKTLFLGDVDDGYDSTGYSNWISDNSKLFPNSLFVVGNHDTKLHTLSEWYTDVFSNMENVVWGSTDDLYYYYDNNEWKIRLIVANANNNSAAQKTWYRNAIESTPNGWTYFLLQHHMMVNPSRGTPSSGNVKTLVELGKIAADMQFGSAITGHWHNDDSTQRYGFIQQDILACDTKKIDFGWTPSEYMVDGTNNCQGVTIISINPNAKTIKFYRIGLEDTSAVSWANHRREVNYGVERGVLDGYWTKSDGTFQEQDGAKMWMTPQPVDAAQTYYIYHVDGTDLHSDITCYNWFCYDANGHYISRGGTKTQISNKVWSVVFPTNTAFVISASWYGDEFALSTEQT